MQINFAPLWSRQLTSILTIAALLILSVAVAIPQNAQAAVAFGSVSSASNNPSNGDDIESLSITKPTSTASGDFLIAGISVNGGDETDITSAPSGWTLLERTDNDDDIMFVTYYKVAGGSEPASYSWGFDANGNTARIAGGILRYTGVNTADPIDVWNENEGDDDEPTASSVTTTAADARVIAFFAVDDDDTLGTPSGTTERYDVFGSTSGPRTSAADFTQASAGSTGAKEAGDIGGNEPWIAQMVALNVALTSQTITVGTNAPGSAVYGSTFNVAATASSALSVAITTTGGCSNVAGLVTMTSGTVSCVVHYNQAGNGTYSAAPEVTESVTAQLKGLTVTGLTAGNKTYDGTTSASLSGTAALSGVVGLDDVTLAGSPVATFNNKNIGTGKPVSVTGYTLSGSTAVNYSLTQPALSADITARDLTVTATGINKLWDGNTDADVTLSTDKVEDDDVTASGSAAFEDSDVGNDKPVDVSSIGISGDDASNYNLLNTTAETTADITENAVDVIWDSGDLTVTYDGTPKSLGFVTDPEGHTLSVTYDGDTDAPTAAGEYEVVATVTDTGYAGSDTQTLTIEPAELTITADNKEKTYGSELTFDGSADFESTGLVEGDSITSVVLSSTGASAGAGVGSYDIEASDASGEGLSNYDITYVDGELTVNPAELTVTPDDKSKLVGTLFTAFTGTVDGLQNEDEVSVTYGSDGAPVEAAVGTYDITASLGESEVLSNYTVVLNVGTLTVSETEPEPEPESNPDSDTTPAGGGGIVGLVNSFGAPGFQPGSVLGAFTTGAAENQAQGQVLGESTSDLALQCKEGRLLTSNLGINRSNPADQVKLLQAFLNMHQNANLPQSGVYGPMTFGAVQAFQSAHADEILAPWGLTAPSGYTGILTRYMIDKILCGADYPKPVVTPN